MTVADLLLVAAAICLACAAALTFGPAIGLVTAAAGFGGIWYLTGEAEA